MDPTPDDNGMHNLAAELPQARQAAYRFLAARQRSEAEVARRLNRRFSHVVVEQVVDELRDRGYLDDTAFAREWRRQREHHRPRGPGILRKELWKLGVASAIINEALTGFDSEGNAYRAAASLAGRLAGGDYQAFRRKIWAHLQRRGFEAAVIGDTVSQLWRELAHTVEGGVGPNEDE